MIDRLINYFVEMKGGQHRVGKYVTFSVIAVLFSCVMYLFAVENVLPLQPNIFLKIIIPSVWFFWALPLAKENISSWKRLAAVLGITLLFAGLSAAIGTEEVNFREFLLMIHYVLLILITFSLDFDGPLKLLKDVDAEEISAGSAAGESDTMNP